MLVLKFFLGIVILAFGRRLYWLFLGVVGFVLAFDLAGRVIQGQPQNVKVLFAVIAGVCGAALAVIFQKIAVVAGGFLAGGYLCFLLMKGLGIGADLSHWILFVAGGLIGALLMRVLFDFTLIVLSSGMGAVLIVQALHFSIGITRPLFVVLLVLGIAAQCGFIRRKSAQ